MWQNRFIGRVLGGASGACALRFLSTTSMGRPASLSIVTKRPVRLRAAWVDELKFPAESNRFRLSHNKQNDVYRFEDINVEGDTGAEDADSGSVLEFEVPRRCKSVSIKSNKNITIASQDRLEVEDSIEVLSQLNVDVNCTLRAKEVKVSAVGDVKCKSAVEGVNINITSADGAVQIKRVGAKVAEISSSSDLTIASIYADDVALAVAKGHAKLGAIHGRLEINVGEGHLDVESLSGCINATVNGNSRVHLEQSEADVTHHIVATNQLDLTLSVDTLPLSLEGQAEMKLTDPDVIFDQGVIKLTRPTPKDGAGKMIIQSETATVSILSWIESVRLKAERRIAESEGKNL